MKKKKGEQRKGEKYIDISYILRMKVDDIKKLRVRICLKKKRIISQSLIYMNGEI